MKTEVKKQGERLTSNFKKISDEFRLKKNPNPKIEVQIFKKK